MINAVPRGESGDVKNEGRDCLTARVRIGQKGETNEGGEREFC